MARRVKYYAWREDGHAERESVRRYEVYEIHAGHQEYDMPYADLRAVLFKLYVDEQTGIVVNDIEAYEISTGDVRVATDR